MSWLERLRDAVQADLRTRHPDAGLTVPVTLEGGLSGVTLVARLTGAGPERDVVLKAAPEGRKPVGRHDVLRQADILDAVADTPVVVPRVLARISGEHTAFAMERAAGEAVEPVLDAATTVLVPEVVRERAVHAARMLADLHAVDLATVPATPTAAAGDEVERWSATAAAADPAVAPNIDRLYERLRDSAPTDAGRAVLVHGDYRLGNILYDGITPTGVIDWEIWGVTAAAVDLGWFLVFCDADAFPGIGGAVEGLPSATELLDVYREAGGSVPEDVAWFDAFGRFKMAAIMAHNLRRHREGRHHDPYQERLPPTIARLVETGLERVGSGARA
jgi:aminoglycoside phosphotransferase (APT) family kinase protein